MKRTRVSKRAVQWIVLGLVLSGCAAISVNNFEKMYGKSEPRDRVVTTLPSGTVDYWSEVKPVVDQRCVVCHGCYDASCQLKMSSIEGIQRGANKERVYDQSRLTPANPSRLFEDADSVAQWREMGFHPVLNEYQNSPEANRQASVMYRMLQLKEQHPLPAGKLLPKSLTLGLSRKESCTIPEEFDSYAKDHPLWGMPYALPGLAAEEQNVLMSWVEQGAPYTARPALSSDTIARVDEWESFLNGQTLKAQLASRYIYEHLFIAHLYFSDSREPRFFQLVRSSTPPGEKIEILATRQPYDDPGVDRIYYRLREVVSSIVQKTHMPYALNEARLERWQSLFMEPDYVVTTLPSRDSASASNPFITFAAIPVESRYKFMLDEAHFTINAFIKGPVCRGDVAVNVINDHFWVFFSNPDTALNNKIETFLSKSGQSLELPASTESIYRPLKRWREYKKQQSAFLARKDEFMASLLDESAQVTLNSIWDGNGSNQNAGLTIIRHADNATVEKGLLGQPPKTAWLIDYSLLERIHYLLVAGYDVYGNLGHQLDTRLYMSFLRMEGESNFLILLPKTDRSRVRDYWYRNVDAELKAYVSSPVFDKKDDPDIDYKTDDPQQELYALLKQRLAAVQSTAHELSSTSNKSLARALDKLNKVIGTPVNVLPEVAPLRINTAAGAEYFTLIRNTAYDNMTGVFRSGKNRMPAEDTLTVYRGIIGAYPNVFLVVDEDKVSEFVASVSDMKTEKDYGVLLDNYGIRRTNPEFWRYSDELLTALEKSDPLYYGLLDYNRLENR